jgi:hypothetical protein
MARIVLVTTAAGRPDQVLADYDRAFRGFDIATREATIGPAHDRY